MCGVVDSKTWVSQFVIAPLVQLKLTEGDSLALCGRGHHSGLFPYREFLDSVSNANTEKRACTWAGRGERCRAGGCVAGLGETCAAGPAAVESFPRSALSSCLCHFLPLAHTHPWPSSELPALAAVTPPVCRGEGSRAEPATWDQLGLKAQPLFLICG